MQDFAVQVLFPEFEGENRLDNWEKMKVALGEEA